MNNKTLALLFVTVAVTGLNAHAAEQKKEAAKTTCMKELQKGKGVQANMNASVKCQDRAIGRLAMAGVLTGDELTAVMNKQKEFTNAVKDANKDKKVTAEERKELQALKKEATSAVFETSWNEGAAEIRLKKLEDRIYAAETKQQLTASEMALLVPKLDEVKALFEKSKAGGLSTAEKKKLREQMKLLNQQVLDDRQDEEGVAAKIPDRTKDGIDEVRRNQAARVVACFSEGKNMGNFTEQFTALNEVRKKESAYLADGALDKAETDDLNMLYKTAAMDISSVCGPTKKTTTGNGLAPTPTPTPSPTGNETGIGTTQDGPKSDVPADPSKKVGIGL